MFSIECKVRFTVCLQGHTSDGYIMKGKPFGKLVWAAIAEDEFFEASLVAHQY